MNKQQLDTVVGLIGGCETALITMADYLSSLNLLDKQALANHFDATATNLDANIQHRHLLEMVLRQVASGLRSTSASDQSSIQALFH